MKPTTAFHRSQSNIQKTHSYVFPTLLALLLSCALLLSSCGTGEADIPPICQVETSDASYTLDTEQNRITYLGKEYSYQVSKGSSSGTGSVSVTVNNGSYSTSYRKTEHGIASSTSTSGSYNADSQLIAWALTDVIYDAYLGENGFLNTHQPSAGTWLAGLVLLGLGILDICAPKAAWWCTYGWRFKNAEPSDAALLFGRIGGVIAALVGFFIMVSA
ncbi:MAG: hypothetical protein J6B85_00425 [Lachnospiraceae bacterium]|nr:hypothetical protein [Lachnospiraceae bacterium]